MLGGHGYLREYTGSIRLRIRRVLRARPRGQAHLL